MSTPPKPNQDKHGRLFRLFHKITLLFDGQTSDANSIMPTERLNWAFIGSLGTLVGLNIILFSFTSDLSARGNFVRISLTLLMAVASYVVGGIIGFLFGIPRTLQAAAGGTTAKNTSLEQISDWLTKIIVGVGLTQFRVLKNNFDALAYNAGQALVSDPKLQNQATVIAGCIIISFSAIGFFMTYLWTRLFLDRIETSDIQAGIKNQDDLDRVARDLAMKQLNGGTVDADQLLAALKKATGNTVTGIYVLAENQLRNNMSGAENAEKMKIDYTVPIFEVLTSIDTRLDYPENYEQLGLACYAKENPDYNKAILNFSKSIDAFRTRNPQQRIGMIYYYRALCRVLAAANAVLDDNTKQLTLTDLKTAATEEPVATLIKRKPELAPFLADLGLK